MCGLFKRNCLLGAPEVSSTTSIPAGVAARSCGDLSSWHWNPGLGGSGVGLDLLIPEISLLNFYPPHMGERSVCCMSEALLPVWMNVVS